MAEIMLDYKDITEIFKNNLHIVNMVKPISSIFLTKRFFERIDYKPYFQRHYVWDVVKATYFIESIFLGTEIPPLVLFDNGKKNEVIDGRQRYETILRFLNNDLILAEEGLKALKSFAGNRYVDLPDDIKEKFKDTKLRILQCSVTNEPSLDEQKEDKIKKEIFRRYNSGIVPLKKEEIQRAEFIDDDISKAFSQLLNLDLELFNRLCLLFLPKRQYKVQKRDKMNKLLSIIRTLITLPFIPINNYANRSSKNDDIGAYYRIKVAKIDINSLIDEFKEITNALYNINLELHKDNHVLSDNILLYECCFWIFTIIFRDFNEIYNEIDIANFIDYVVNNEKSETIFQSTGSHYHKAIKDRYSFVAQYFIKTYKLSLEKYFSNLTDFKETINKKEVQVNEIRKYKLNKHEPTSLTIEDICEYINSSRFLIRPDYQRSEVTNPIKSSYLLESIMLGMRIPPIFIYKRNDKVYEVIDGQQRLLSIIGFLGKEYLNEKNKKEISIKHKFKLRKLRILESLNGCTIDNVDSQYVNKILDFQLDVVEIDEEDNPTFESIDLFLRLNTKPYPIGENTFEMWNSYVDKNLILSIRKLSDAYSGKIFKPNDTRMGNEDLIASLAYIDYKSRIIKSDIKSILDIYVRSGRINARIKRKSDVTKVLSDVTKNDTTQFLESIESVELFIEKIKVLTNNDFDYLDRIFDPLYSSKRSRTNQNFYFLWIILGKYSKSQLESKFDEIRKSISDLYLQMQNYPDSKSVDDFFLAIDSLPLV